MSDAPRTPPPSISGRKLVVGFVTVLAIALAAYGVVRWRVLGARDADRAAEAARRRTTAIEPPRVGD